MANVVPAVDLEGDVLHEHPRPPPDSQIVDDDVRPWRSTWSDAQQRVEEREQRVDHDHAEDGQHHGGRRAGADRGRAALRGQPLTAGDQADRERQKRALDEARPASGSR